MPKLKLYRLTAKNSGYDNLTDAVVWAHSAEDAQTVLSEWHKGYDLMTDTMPGRGDWAGPYEVTEVPIGRKVVLTHVTYG